ncbi:MAG: hypothetical protein MUO60_06460 [Clostridiaceae bacterium]|nr:hypothetical protein [Clostridiaceae bacterium]
MRNIRSEIIFYTTTVIVIILVILGLISYRWTKGIIELRVSESTVETLKQIDKNIHSMVGDAQDISLFIISNRNVRNYLRLDKNKTNNINDALLYLNEDLANLGNSKSYISAINIYGDNGLSFETLMDIAIKLLCLLKIFLLIADIQSTVLAIVTIDC